MIIRCLSKQPVVLVFIDSIVLRCRIRNVRAGIGLLLDLTKISVGIGGGVLESPPAAVLVVLVRRLIVKFG